MQLSSQKTRHRRNYNRWLQTVLLLMASKEQVFLHSIYYIRIVFMQLPTPCHFHDANPTAVLTPPPPNPIAVGFVSSWNILQRLNVQKEYLAIARYLFLNRQKILTTTKNASCMCKGTQKLRCPSWQFYMVVITLSPDANLCCLTW